jgi:CheY-like chemotaxis protein
MNKLIAELDSIRGKLTGSKRPKKPKMLVVDDEPDNLDLLYRTFRRDFQVLKADSGASALSILANEGEVAVIISDQRMPEMKGTEFLSKTVPEFPDTVRIILTGFTDVEDLVEAINSGQVYKYITKPWDPDELKGVVQRAADSYETIKERSQELTLAHAQTQLLATIIQVTQGANTPEAALGPIAQAFGQAFGADACVLQCMEAGQLTGTAGSYPNAGAATPDWFDADPLVKAAITTHSVQVCVDTASDPALSSIAPYSDGTVKGHLVLPAIYRDRPLALLSLQWANPRPISDNEFTQAYVAIQQVALAIISFNL